MNAVRNSDATSAKRAQLGILFNVLASVGMLSEERANIVSSSLAELEVSLMGVIFFITQRVLTYCVRGRASSRISHCVNIAGAVRCRRPPPQLADLLGRVCSV